MHFYTLLQLQGSLWDVDEDVGVGAVVVVDARFVAVVSSFETGSVNTCIVAKDSEFSDGIAIHCSISCVYYNVIQLFFYDWRSLTMFFWCLGSVIDLHS